jgi:hypothetical protein
MRSLSLGTQTLAGLTADADRGPPDLFEITCAQSSSHGHKIDYIAPALTARLKTLLAAGSLELSNSYQELQRGLSAGAYPERDLSDLAEAFRLLSDRAPRHWRL